MIRENKFDSMDRMNSYFRDLFIPLDTIINIQYFPDERLPYLVFYRF